MTDFLRQEARSKSFPIAKEEAMAKITITNYELLITNYYESLATCTNRFNFATG